MLDLRKSIYIYILHSYDIQNHAIFIWNNNPPSKKMVVSKGSSRCFDIKNIVVHVIIGRWFVVFASLLIMAVSGSTFMFGLYSGDIKSVLGYNQTTLNLLSFFKDLGANVGILSGLINEVTPPWVILLIGALMNFFGYFMIWLSVTRRIFAPKVWQMCLYICMGGSSQNFANTGALVTCVNNFPERRGIVLGKFLLNFSP